jgi:hypothetical protein
MPAQQARTLAERIDVGKAHRSGTWLRKRLPAPFRRTAL